VDATPPAVLAADPDGGAVPGQAGLQRVLGPLLADPRLGPGITASVSDAETGRTLYGVRPTVPVPPASTAKVVTAVAVLAAVGPDARLVTRAVAGAAPGEVVLVGGGDPTLTAGRAGAYPGAARLDVLAAAVRTALRGTRPTRVVVDGSLWTGPLLGPGWDADVVGAGYGAPATAVMLDGGRVSPRSLRRTTVPDLSAGRALARLLRVPASAVVRGTAPPGAPQLGSVSSPPVATLVELMLQRSDNVLAEALARRVAVARGAPASFAGAAGATRAVITDLGLDVSGQLLVDGSGLSRGNRLTADLLTRLLVAAAAPDQPRLRAVLSGLPVAAWSGTLEKRFVRGAALPAAGLVRAKTGTLSGVSALAGVVVDADGRQLAFAVVASRVPPGGRLGAEAALDRVAAALAGCGC